jgi:hypothetical protein
MKTMMTSSWSGDKRNNHQHHNGNNSHRPPHRRFYQRLSFPRPPTGHGARFVVLAAAVVMALQLVLNSVLHRPPGQPDGRLASTSRRPHDAGPISSSPSSSQSSWLSKMTSSLFGGPSQQQLLLQQQQRLVEELEGRIATMERADPSLYVEDPRFYPFVIRDSRHLVPNQLRVQDHFHVFDYVDIGSAKQVRSRNSQLFADAALVADAPCQFYSIKCYRHKIVQVFRHALERHPQVQYYFYMEADNDLCVPMGHVQDLAIREGRYFINTGIGFSGWIMSRQFLHDFLVLYTNITLSSNKDRNTQGDRDLAVLLKKEPEIRPDVLASYYLTDRHAWTVTRQYWVSHTTLESLGASSLTVKDRRRVNTGERLTLDKHLPRCLEPRRGKWKISIRHPLDPRDRFGWDYFDYDVCPDSVIFPCGGPNQLAQLVADDLRVANETGALAKAERTAEAGAAFEGGGGNGSLPRFHPPPGTGWGKQQHQRQQQKLEQYRAKREEGRVNAAGAAGAGAGGPAGTDHRRVARAAAESEAGGEAAAAAVPQKKQR